MAAPRSPLAVRDVVVPAGYDATGSPPLDIAFSPSGARLCVSYYIKSDTLAVEKKYIVAEFEEFAPSRVFHNAREPRIP